MSKNIKELTEQEAKEILEFVYPITETVFRSLSFEAEIDKDGFEQVSFSGFRSLIGINYYNGQDDCILYFDNTKAVLWLYKHGYDITEQLETNGDMSKDINNYDNMGFEISMLAKGPEGFKEEVRIYD